MGLPFPSPPLPWVPLLDVPLLGMPLPFPAPEFLGDGSLPEDYLWPCCFSGLPFLIKPCLKRPRADTELERSAASEESRWLGRQHQTVADPQSLRVSATAPNLRSQTTSSTNAPGNSDHGNSGKHVIARREDRAPASHPLARLACCSARPPVASDNGRRSCLPRLPCPRRHRLGLGNAGGDTGRAWVCRSLTRRPARRDDHDSSIGTLARGDSGVGSRRSRRRGHRRTVRLVNGFRPLRTGRLNFEAHVCVWPKPDVDEAAQARVCASTAA